MIRERMSVMQAHTVEGNNPVAIHNVTATPFPLYGHEPKRLLRGVVDGGLAAYVERNDGLRNDGAFSAVWLEGHECGLPVTPGLLRTDDGKVLVPDVKADGSEVYGKAMACLEPRDENARPRVRFRPRRHIDPIFLDLVHSSERDIMHDQAWAFGELATRHEVRLPTDDSFEVKVHPTGKWELVLLDLGWVRPRQTSSADAWTLQRRKEAIAENNRQSLSTFSFFLKEAIDFLTRQTTR